MLESIRNAVKWLIQTGTLKTERVQVKRNVFQTNFRLAPEYQQEHVLKALYEKITQFSGSVIQDFAYVSREMRKLTVSDILPRL